MEAHTEDGSTAFLWACYNGHLAVARVLLEHGAVVDPATSIGWTPLIAASFQGHGEIVRLLLDNDADPSIKDKDGWTALSWAQQMMRQGVVDMLEVKQKRGWRGRGGRRSRKRAFAHLVVALPFPPINHSADPSTPSVFYHKHTLTLSALRSPPPSARC